MRSVYCEQLSNVIMLSVYCEQRTLLLCGLSIVNNGHCYYAVCLLGTMDKCLYFRSIHGEQWTNVIMRSVYCVRYNGQCYHALGTTESLLRTVHTL